MDAIAKQLKKLSPKERKAFKALLQQILNQEFRDLDIKKLKKQDNIYRVRKGNYRIIFRIDEQNDTYILSFEKRSEKTYTNY